jgi:hypothetical protein
LSFLCSFNPTHTPLTFSPGSAALFLLLFDAPAPHPTFDRADGKLLITAMVAADHRPHTLCGEIPVK